MPTMDTYPAQTTPNNSDYHVINDGVSGVTKKITRTNYLKGAALPTDTVTTAAIADDAVTSAKIDYSSGVSWEEIGRTTLGVAGDTISVASLPARKYLQIRFSGTGTGAINQTIRFNNDSGSNYYQNIAVNGGAGAGTGSASQITLSSGDSNNTYQTILEVTNITAKEKMVIANCVLSAAGAASVATMVQATAKWANTSAQINRVDFINTGAGDWASGAEVVVFARD